MITRENFVEKSEEITKKFPEIELYLIIWYAGKEMDFERKRDGNMTMGMWPIDIPKIIPEELTRIKGDDFAVKFFNKMIMLGIDSYMTSMEKTYKKEINEYFLMANTFVENMQEDLKKDLINSIGEFEKSNIPRDERNKIMSEIFKKISL